MAKDYYKILGVDKNASAEEIKKKYKKLAIQYHPDKQQGKSEQEKKDAEEKFKEINEAYSILSDSEKRQQYDTFGTVGGNMGGMSGADAMAEFMKHFKNMGGFGDFGFGGFEDLFGSHNTQSKGTTIQVNVSLSLSELFNNSKKTIRYDRYVPCRDCKGTGSKDGKSSTCSYCHGTGMITTTTRHGFSIIQQSSVCPNCKGTGTVVQNPCGTCGGKGVVRKEETYTFDIPKGVTDKAFMDVAGMGNACENGKGVDGDLRIVFNLKSEKGFTVNQKNWYDLEYILELPIIDCITGCDKNLEYINGHHYKITIKPGMSDGHIIRLKGLGLSDSYGRRGNLNIIIKQKMPSSLTKSELELLDKLKKSKNFK